MFNKTGLKFVAARFIFFNVLLLLGACSNNAEQTPDTKAPEKKESKYLSILAKCKEAPSDTLHIYSVGNIYDAKDFQYKGTLLDSAETALLMPLISKEENNADGHIYACYKIAIDENHTGIIARTPAMYDDSSIKFFTLDNGTDSISAFIELGEIWGDAGDVLEKQSWIYKNAEQKLTAFLWQTIIHDFSVEDPVNTKVDETNDYLLLDLSKPKPDTISKTAKELSKTFQRKKRS